MRWTKITIESRRRLWIVGTIYRWVESGKLHAIEPCEAVLIFGYVECSW